jgi:energy-coupling factor transporter ATP-binding protein EcfA2
MRLKKVQVTNFRSVEDSGEFQVDQSTCLVGKNEAGKTAILHALAGLNPHPSTPIEYDIERDYPRRFLAEYDERHPDEDAEVIRTVWELDDDQISRLEELIGSEAISDREAIISRSYESDGPFVEVPLDEAKALQHLLNRARFNAAEAASLRKCTTEAELRSAVSAMEAPSEKHKALISSLDELPEKNIIAGAAAIIRDGLPQFMYFSHYDRMVGQIQLATFAQRERREVEPRIKAGERVFVDFLEYAGTSLEEINEAKTYESLNAKCESASNRITEQLLEYWTQNPFLEIDIRVTKGEPEDPPPFNNGVVARARVKNDLHKVTVPFSERSAGFIWFFSFLVKFAQVRKQSSNLFLLLDEPGLTLHGKAQEDLLRYFAEKLEPHHQLMFSTHSPFMVPADRLETVRTVEDRVITDARGRSTPEGTKVSEESLARDPDTLFPLQGALGYSLTQTLFVGKHTLLVEGPSDILYLQIFSDELKRRGRNGLDQRWTLCPAGGIDKIQSFVSLFSGQNLHIAAITDFAKGDGQKLKNLERSGLLEGNRLKTLATILDQSEADVEDIFEPSLYAELLTASFDLASSGRIDEAKLLAEVPQTERIVKKAEACFRVLPAAPEFDHYTPAAWLLRNPAFLEGDSEPILKSLERAESVIAAANSMLD